MRRRTARSLPVLSSLLVAAPRHHQQANSHRTMLGPYSAHDRKRQPRIFFVYRARAPAKRRTFQPAARGRSARPPLGDARCAESAAVARPIRDGIAVLPTQHECARRPITESADLVCRSLSRTQSAIPRTNVFRMSVPRRPFSATPPRTPRGVQTSAISAHRARDSAIRFERTTPHITGASACLREPHVLRVHRARSFRSH